MFIPWIRSFFNRQPKTYRRPFQSVPRKAAMGFRPMLEGLEDRVVPAFLAPVSYGGSAGIMTVGDFNGDGKLDLVTVGGVVSVLRGNGDGTFQSALTSPLNAVAGSTFSNAQGHTAVAADFNGDGKLDLAVVCGSVDEVMVLAGNGDGTFQTPSSVFFGLGITRLTAADLNGDGHQDLIVANAGGAVSVRLGIGNGTFGSQANYAAGTDAQDVKAVDLNGDGKLDLVVANAVSAGTVAVLMGNGDGTFQPENDYPAFSAPYELVVGDFNNDGHMDVAVDNSYTSSYVSVLLGNGGGLTYSGSHNVETQPWDIETGDFNNDGHLDLIEGTSNGAALELESGYGNGTFAPTQTLAAPAGSNFAVGDFNADGATDVATSGASGLSVLINSNNGLLNLAGTTSFSVSSAATAVAGTPLAVTVTARDATGAVAPGYTGTVAFASSDMFAGLPANYTFTAADAGSHTFNVTFKVAGTQSFSVKDAQVAGVTGSQTGIVVSPGAAVSISVGTQIVGLGNPNTFVAGVAHDFPIRVYDAFGNLVSNYTGTVAISSTDVRAILPSTYTFIAGDGGGALISGLFATAGPQTVTVRDTVNPALSGSSTFAVLGGTVNSLTVAGGAGPAGVYQSVTITALDGFGNISSYNGTVHLSSSDPLAVLPADTAMNNGRVTVGVHLMTVGTQTLTATDTANATLVASESVLVTAPVLATFDVTGYPATTAGAAQNFTVTARNSIGQVMTGYTGTVRFSSSDPQAVLPANYTFSSSDNGTHTFSATLKTAGSQTISAIDYIPSVNVYASFYGSESGIAVSSTTAVQIVMSNLPNTVAGVAKPVTVTARDMYGNVAAGYTGTVMFTSTDAQASLPANYTFTVADAGIHTFTVILKTAAGGSSSPGQSVAVQDIANALLLSSQTNILVSAGALDNFNVTTPANAPAGSPFSVKAIAQDAYGNKIDTYLGTVHFSTNGASLGLPADYTFTSTDRGQQTFTVTLTTGGVETVSIGDTLDAHVQGTAALNVTAAAGSAFVATGFPTTTAAGVAQSFTLTVLDIYGNVASGYRGTVSFSSSDAQAGLPTNYSFTAADAGVHTFLATLKTAGTQSITVKDTTRAALTTTQSGISVTASTTAGAFLVAGFPATTAGVAQSFTVRVKDAFGNFSTGYTGTVTFSSSDVQAGLPASYTFTTLDAGIHTFTATLKTAGTQSITVKDAANATAVGSQTGISVVSAGNAVSFAVSGFPATTAGVAHTFTVTARDAYGNLTTGYTGTVVFSSSDVQAGLPASYTFMAADAGVHTFTATLKRAGAQSITVKDATDSTILGSQTGIAVSAAAGATFSISAPSSVTQGVGFKFTMTVLDAYGNVATGYRGKVHLSSTDPKQGTQDYTFSSSDNGVHVFSFTFSTLGFQTLTLVDSANSSIVGSAIVNVVPK